MDNKLRYRKGTWKKRTLEHIRSFVTDPLPEEEAALWAARMSDNRRFGAAGEKLYEELRRTYAEPSVWSDVLMVLLILRSVGMLAKIRYHQEWAPYKPEVSMVTEVSDYQLHWHKSTAAQFEELLKVIDKVGGVE